MTITAPLPGLEAEIASHPALHHPFLQRFATEPLSIGQLRAFGLQHYQLVRVFTTYMTNLIARRPDWGSSLRCVLDDELGGHTVFRSHVHLYRDFLKGLGLRDEDWGRAELEPETKSFIDSHLALTREGDILAALGAIGPGHELSIPVMFGFLLEGLRRSTALTRELEYFSLHISQDKNHALAFDELIESNAPDAGSLARVRQGALFSLFLRSRFWSGCERVVFDAGAKP